MYSLDNKVAVVTGSAQGIGLGIAFELARSGSNVIVADTNFDKAIIVAKKLKHLGVDAIALQLDVTSPESIKKGVQDALAHFPTIDILVNNAGVMGRAAIAGNTGVIENDCINVPEDFDLCYNVNLKGIWNVSSALIPHFKTNQAGKIVNISSVCGRRGNSALPAYCASKAGAISLTQSLASSLGPHNINVNTICPGTVDTPGADNVKENLNMPTFCEDAAKDTLLNRLATPEDIGHAVVFLVSPQASSITGQALNVDGGLYMN